MNSSNKGIRLKEIKFLSENGNSSINLDAPVYVLNGASNTGKSFLVESIDYMLGKEKIETINEANEFNEIQLKITLNNKPFTLYRKFTDSRFEIYNDFLDKKEPNKFKSFYKTGNPTREIKNINDFFLSEMQLYDKLIASNLWAEKNNLTIRLLSRIIFSKEEKIISLTSPIEGGDNTERSTNRNVFKFLLTGADDSSKSTITRENDFKVERIGRLGALKDVIGQLESNLNFPEESLTSLNETKEKISNTESDILNSLAEANKGLSETVKERERVYSELAECQDRKNDLFVNSKNFERLKKIYQADIERLKSQEEAAFLLTVGHDGECSVCGSQSKLVCNDLRKIRLLAKASVAEIFKIEQKSAELQSVLKVIDVKISEVLSSTEELTNRLNLLDKTLAERAPNIKEKNDKLKVLRGMYSQIVNDIFIRSRVNELNIKIQNSESANAPKKYASSDFYPSTDVINGFCRIYSNILTEIKFPGEHSVDFDYKKFDVKIGGKARHLNGKGVRAILNSVFKISLLKYCRENNLFHPGLVILDSPLLTYRDPLKSKHGDLNKDEIDLANTKISYRFLNYLSSLSDLAQFIIIENIDIPDGLGDSITVESFYGEGASHNDRYGLF